MATDFEDVFEGFHSLFASALTERTFSLENALFIQMDLPGRPRDTISVTVEDGLLSIQAKAISAGPSMPISDRRGVSRQWRLPAKCDGQKVTADYLDGVLTVRLPFKEQSTQRVEVPLG